MIAFHVHLIHLYHLISYSSFQEHKRSEWMDDYDQLTSIDSIFGSYVKVGSVKCNMATQQSMEFQSSSVQAASSDSYASGNWNSGIWNLYLHGVYLGESFTYSCRPLVKRFPVWGQWKIPSGVIFLQPLFIGCPTLSLQWVRVGNYEGVEEEDGFPVFDTE